MSNRYERTFSTAQTESIRTSHEDMITLHQPSNQHRTLETTTGLGVERPVSLAPTRESRRYYCLSLHSTRNAEGHSTFRHCEKCETPAIRRRVPQSSWRMEQGQRLEAHPLLAKAALHLRRTRRDLVGAPPAPGNEKRPPALRKRQKEHPHRSRAIRGPRKLRAPSTTPIQQQRADPVETRDKIHAPPEHEKNLLLSKKKIHASKIKQRGGQYTLPQEMMRVARLRNRRFPTEKHGKSIYTQLRRNGTERSITYASTRRHIC